MYVCLYIYEYTLNYTEREHNYFAYTARVSHRLARRLSVTQSETVRRRATGDVGSFDTDVPVQFVRKEFIRIS